MMKRPWDTRTFKSTSFVPFLLHKIWNPQAFKQNENRLKNHCDENNYLQRVYWNRGHPDFENQSDDRTERTDSNIFKSGQSNAR